MRENKVLNNAKWIIACKVIQSLIQLAVGMLSARYLGPSGYGLIHYAASIAAFVIPIMQLGLTDTLVREYVDSPEKEGEILGTALAMNLLSAVVCIAGVTAFAAAANRGERTTILVCVLYSTSLFFQGIEMVQYWFQAKLMSKYSSLAMLCSYVVVCAYKLWLLIAGKSVCWFALSHTVEYGITGLLLLVIYQRKGTKKLSLSRDTARKLFARSRHYILATIMAVACSSTASVMIKLMVGETENGYFSAAVTCMAVVQFVYYALIDSARPVILACRKADRNQFETCVSGLYSLIVYTALAQSAVFTLLAGQIIRFLYGAAYLPAVPVLQILIWQIAFSYMGAVRNIWILAEGKDSRLFTINLCGAAANMALNAVLIPRWSACGAAVASVLTQIITNFVLGFLVKDIRPNNRLLLAGLNPRRAWKTLGGFLQETGLERVA